MRTHSSPHKRRILASPVLLYLMAHVSASISEIARWAEMSHETVSTHLHNLPPEMVTRTNGKRWTLTEGGIKELLGERAYLASGMRQLADTTREVAYITRDNQLPATAIDLTNSELKAVVVEQNPAYITREVAYITRDGENQLESVNNEHINANLAALRTYGVGRNNTVLEICARENVTPGVIKAQATRLKKERRLTAAMLITVLRDDDPIVAEEQSPDRTDGEAYATWNED